MVSPKVPQYLDREVFCCKKTKTMFVAESGKQIKFEALAEIEETIYLSGGVGATVYCHEIDLSACEARLKNALMDIAARRFDIAAKVLEWAKHFEQV